MSLNYVRFVAVGLIVAAMTLIPASASSADTLSSISGVGSEPWVLDVTADSAYVYIGSRDTNEVAVMNASGVPQGLPIVVADIPCGIALQADGSHAYVTHSSLNTVSVIDTVTRVVVSVTVGMEPCAVVANPDNSEIYVANRSGNSITVIDTATLATTTFAAGDFAFDLAISPDGGLLYLANRGDNTVSVVSTSSRSTLSTFAAGNNACAIVASPDGAHVYLGSFSDDTVRSFSTTSFALEATYTVPLGPCALAVNPEGNRVYGAGISGTTVSVIDTVAQAVVQVIAVGDSPQAIALLPNGSRAYVAVTGDDIVAILAVEMAPRLTAATLPEVIPASAYSFALPFTAQPTPTFAVTGGALPPGLTLNAATGVISGVPSSTSPNGFTVTASNGFGSDVRAYAFDVAALPAAGTDLPGPLAVAAGLLFGGLILSRRRIMRVVG